jgi:ABC-2 type transport system ATP-binding protein
MPSPTVTVDGLTYYYPTKLALNQVSFSLERGSITALVGPNGAGKSTLLRNLAGLDSPYAGKIHVCGINVQDRPREAHTKIGYLSDDFGLYDELTVLDVLGFMGECHGLTKDTLSTRIQQVIEILRLQDVVTQKCGALSRGWRQRVGIAISILHNPEILILDEPASGLDPDARAELSSLLRTLQKNGMTILVSSHILAELEEYCTAMLVLRDGEIQGHITLSVHQQMQDQSITIHLVTPITAQQEQIILATYQNPSPVISIAKDTLHFSVSPKREEHHLLLKNLIAADIAICSFTLEETSLQSLYLQMTNHS